MFKVGDLVRVLEDGIDLAKKGLVVREIDSEELIVVFQLEYGWYDYRRVPTRIIELLTSQAAEISDTGRVLNVFDRPTSKSRRKNKSTSGDDKELPEMPSTQD